LPGLSAATLSAASLSAARLSSQSAPSFGQTDRGEISPIYAKDFAGLPPTVIVTAGCDILRDEGASLHRALIAAGVTSRYQCVPGVLHGFIRFDAFCPESQQTIDWIATQI
jgi:acetyl esterase/lipase